MIQKRLIRPDRLRRVPPSFNWVDHRLARDHYFERCDCVSLALYLFLVTVSDARGLSYYSEASLCRRLQIDPLELSAARTQLQKAGLVAFAKPLYQVLSLDPETPPPGANAVPRAGQPLSAADILKRLAQGGGL
jgi:hypothetical protein